MFRLAILCVVALVGASVQDKKARHNALVYEASRHFWERRLDLADWAKANGLNREARTLLEFMVRNIPGAHPYKARAEGKLAGSWKKKPNKAAAGKLAEYEERLRDYFAATADKYWASYTYAKSVGLAKEAEESLLQTSRYYLDHALARKERGEVKVDGFGWVSAADAESIRKNAVDVDTLQVDDGKHDTWETAWVVRSKHYAVRSDMPLEKIRSVVGLLEKLYAEVTAFTAGVFPAPPFPLGVHFYRRVEDYDAARKGLPGFTDAPAFFHGGTNLAYVRSFSAADARDAGGLAGSDVEALLHEATHQILDTAAEGRIWSLFQSANSRADAVDNFWVVEGIAVWFACGGKDAWREEHVRGGALAVRLPEFCAYSYEEFMKNAFSHYAVAYMLCRYLIERDRPRFVNFLRAFYSGSGSMATFTEILGARPEEIEKGFLSWMKK